MQTPATTLYFPTEPGHAEFAVSISVRRLTAVDSDPRIEQREPTLAEIKAVSEYMSKLTGLAFCRSTIIGS